MATRAVKNTAVFALLYLRLYDFVAREVDNSDDIRLIKHFSFSFAIYALSSYYSPAFTREIASYSQTIQHDDVGGSV